MVERVERGAVAEIADHEVMQIRAELQHVAALSDRPHEYLSGVEDALRMVRELTHDERRPRPTHRRRERSGGRML